MNARPSRFSLCFALGFLPAFVFVTTGARIASADAKLLPLFNTPQFDLPNAAIGASNAGTITGIVGTPRQIQFGLKLVF